MVVSRLIHDDFWEAAILSDMSQTYLYKKDTLKAERLIVASIEKISLLVVYTLKANSFTIGMN